MRTMILAAALSLATAACAGDDGRRFYKDGASFESYQADAYACDRDTRMAVPMAYGSSAYAQIEGENFLLRCMASKGWAFR